MNRGEIRAELTTQPQARFSSDVGTTALNHWINRADAKIWNAALWPWKIAPPASISVTGGTQTVGCPSGWLRPVGLWNADGDRLEMLPVADFQNMYGDPSIGRGDPIHYAVVSGSAAQGGLIYLGPTPAASATFKVSFVRRHSHFDSAGNIVAGPMSGDTDVPLVGLNTVHDDWHFLNVIGALALGIKLMQGPQEQWAPLEAEFNAGLAEMVAELAFSDGQELEGFEQRVWGDGYAHGPAATTWR